MESLNQIFFREYTALDKLLGEVYGAEKGTAINHDSGFLIYCFISFFALSFFCLFKEFAAKSGESCTCERSDDKNPKRA